MAKLHPILILARASGIQLRRLLSAVIAARRQRTTMRELAALDDHMLRDMGITRLDLQSVLAGSPLVDPTEALAERAKETRAGERALHRERRAWMRLLAPPRRDHPRRAA